MEQREKLGAVYAADGDGDASTFDADNCSKKTNKSQAVLTSLLSDKNKAMPRYDIDEKEQEEEEEEEHVALSTQLTDRATQLARRRAEVDSVKSGLARSVKYRECDAKRMRKQHSALRATART